MLIELKSPYVGYSAFALMPPPLFVRSQMHSEEMFTFELFRALGARRQFGAMNAPFVRPRLVFRFKPSITLGVRTFEFSFRRVDGAVHFQLGLFEKAFIAD